VVTVRDAAALASAILDLHGLDPKLRQVVAQAARQRVEAEYRLDDIVARHRALYRELAGGN
jgi:glycosyltransferase involved in cell wall biosynthesis